ncbi:MAG: chemotaxis protein CheW [Acidimicrobiia bacterium]|nr:chemotaxis protein CheW [Acidimicrobiia bacterium]
MSDEIRNEAPLLSEESTPPGADGGDRLLAFADRLRRGSDDDDADAETPETWVAFSLMNRPYALPVTHVREFAKIGRVSRVPGAPSSVYGVASLRGHAIPIVDIKHSLGLSTDESPEPDRVLVADHQGRRIGLIVDRVDRVFKLLPSLVKEIPPTDQHSAAGRIRGFYEADETTLALLDPHTFLNRASEEPA